MASFQPKPTATFGTLPVFLTSLTTILGAIMFLRFGYAVAHVGFWGVMLIILLGHAVTFPTAMAISEIATNQRVEGGGVYFIISRSFGLTAGGAIGMALFFSQAISAAFYIIAFAEGLDPVIGILEERFSFTFPDKRLITVPTMMILTAVMLTKGAKIGMQILYGVATVLLLSLLFFFMGGTPMESDIFGLLNQRLEQPDDFMYVFAICFPAFTGMAAGVGLSGDLRNPRRAIPLGTMLATIFGALIYMVIAFELAITATPEQLDADQLIMQEIAIWGPIIPMGLAAATISSALGSLMVAPRTLQAIGHDSLLPAAGLNRWLGRENKSGEPTNSSLVACMIGIGFCLVGDINAVAEIISMFFMVTYGSICLISFLEHFAGDPSYRPSFKSRWYLSLFGAIACGWLMFEMNAVYASLSAVLMATGYYMLSAANPDKRGLSAIMQGVIFQVSRNLQLFLQGAYHRRGEVNWRPSVVCISSDSFERQSAFDLIRWLAHHHGFGTYIHFIRGYLSAKTQQEARTARERLIRLVGASGGRIFVDTLVSPSYTTAICQVIQLPGISGHENNGVLFEYAKRDPESLEPLISDLSLLPSANFDIYILGSAERRFGYRRELHIWLTPQDFENANLMILTAYIILGSPEWRNGFVKIFATWPESRIREESKHLRDLIQAGRLPINERNIALIPIETGCKVRDLVNTHSREADLIIRGLRLELIKRKGVEVFSGYEGVGDLLWINTTSAKQIVSEKEMVEAQLNKERDDKEEPG